MTGILLVEDDEAFAEGLGALLADRGYDVLICRDVESAEIVLEEERVGTLISDVKLSGPFRYEGLDLLERAARGKAPPRLIAISGSNAEGLSVAVRESGARFLAKPFQFQHLEQFLDRPAESEHARVRFVPTLREVLAGDGLVSHFQPIVRLDPDRTVAGFEALARIDAPVIGNPISLFRYADKRNESVALNLACVARFIAGGAQLARNADLFINVDGPVFAEGDALTDALAAATSSARLNPAKIVIELNEQHPFPDTPASLDCVERLRAIGFRYAFDDVGIAYSHLPLIGRIRPTYLKISQEFGTSYEADLTRTKLVQNIAALAHEFDCEVILEGIEDESTVEAARAAGIELGQGYLFARPKEAASFLSLPLLRATE